MSKEAEIRRQIRALNNELENAFQEEVAAIKAKLLVCWQNLLAVRKANAMAAHLS